MTAFSTNTGLSQLPEYDQKKDPALYGELTRLRNAIRVLQGAIDGVSGFGGAIVSHSVGPLVLDQVVLGNGSVDIKTAASTPTAGNVLTAHGVGVEPTWDAAAAGGVSSILPGPGIQVSNVGSVYTVTALAVDQPILSYTGTFAHNAYSLRLLNTLYAGPLVHVHRTGDAVGIDVYPAAGTLDMDWAALTTYAAGADVFVATWYDQLSVYPGGNHLSQTTAANRPQICVAGALIPFPGTVSGRYALKTNGTTQWMDTPVDAISVPFTRYTIFQALSVASGQNVTSDNATSSLYFSASGVLDTYNGATQTIHSGILVNDLIAVQEMAGANGRYNYNGSKGLYTPGNDQTQYRSIGASRSGAAGSFFAGLYTEHITWARFVTPWEEKLIYDNQKAYWGTP